MLRNEKRVRSVWITSILLSLLSLATAIHCSSERARRISSGEIAEIVPVYSPDGKWIVFEYFHEDSEGYSQIWLMPVDGGFDRARSLVDDGNSNAEFSWSPDSKWIAYIKDIFTKNESREYSARGESDTQIWKIHIETGEQNQISHFPVGYDFGDRVAWAPNGEYIAFEKEGDLYALPLAGGDPFRLVEVDKSDEDMGEISWLSISPDGSKFLFCSEDETNDEYSSIWIVENEQRATPKRITQGGHDGHPGWAPDSRHICFVRGLEEEDEISIFICSLDNPNDIVRVTEYSNAVDFGPDWSPTGDKIAFCRNIEFKEEIAGPVLWENFHLWEIDVPGEVLKAVEKNLSPDSYPIAID